MNGIVINIDSVLFRLGAFELRWYSLAIVLAIVAAVLIAAHLGKKKGIATEEIYSLALWVVIAGVVGARLFHVIDHWEHYINNPLQILGFQGLAIWGALAGGGVATIVYAKIRHIPLGRLADALAPALLTAHIIGRVGCIINWRCLRWYYQPALGFHLHPSRCLNPWLPPRCANPSLSRV